MDRSFLSDEKVVEASRSFVCIRLATYENKEEAEFMKDLYKTRSGVLENTTFGILSPDGKEKLTATGRGPFHAYRNNDQMAAGMNRIAARYPGAKQAAWSANSLPQMKNLDLGLNVAASDNLPLIVSIADSEKQLADFHAELLPLAWSESLAGQFIYASVLDKSELKPIKGTEEGNSIIVVEPDQFGLSGKVLAQFEAGTSRQKIRSTLLEVIESFPRKHKDHDSHVRIGIQLGIEWESVIPETDPQSIKAKARARGKR